MEVNHTLGPWVVRRGVCRYDHPDTSADVHGPNGEFVADCGCHEMANGNAGLIAVAPELRQALVELVAIIDSAGLLNLSNGVQLGATSWYVKASDRMDYAKRILEKADKAQSSGAVDPIAADPGTLSPRA